MTSGIDENKQVESLQEQLQELHVEGDDYQNFQPESCGSSKNAVKSTEHIEVSLPHSFGLTNYECIVC